MNIINNPLSLEERFFHHIMMIYDASVKLKQKQDQFDRDIHSLDRLENVLDASEADLAALTKELHDITFELMLHTPCHKFNKLLDLLDYGR
jgi:hypothetical protein